MGRTYTKNRAIIKNWKHTFFECSLEVQNWNPAHVKACKRYNIYFKYLKCVGIYKKWCNAVRWTSGHLKLVGVG
jgi:hypothetical protein